MNLITDQQDRANALDWVRECLSTDKTLSRRVLERTELDGLPIMAIVPSDVRKGDVRSGFGTRDASTRLLFEYLSTWRERDMLLVVVDELLTRADHSSQQEFGTHILVYREEIYHWAPLSSFTHAEELETFFNWSSTGHPLDGFLVGGQEYSGWKAEERIGELSIDSLAEGTQALIVGAYDSDGFLLLPLSA
jgi:hypothetical protein